MSWEMAMARALISCRPQIPWDPARGQETRAPPGCQMACFILLSEKEAILSVSPGCKCWHCQELRAGWGRGRRKLEKFPFHSRENQTTPLGLGVISELFWPLFQKQSSPFFSPQGEASKSLPCERPKRGNVDLDPSQSWCHGTVGLRENGCHKRNPVVCLFDILGWELSDGIEKSAMTADELSGGTGWHPSIHSSGLSF